MRFFTLFTLCFIVHFTNAQNTFSELCDKGYLSLEKGDASNAKRSFELAQKLLSKTSTLEEKAVFYNDFGVACYQSGEYKKGIDHYMVSLNCYRKMRNDSLIAGALHNLGLAYKDIGLFARATETLTESARIFEKNGSRKELSSAWNSIGNVQRKLGNYSKALEYHFKALRIRQNLEYNKGIADSYHNIGAVFLDIKQFDKSEFYLLRALKLKQSIENKSNELTTLTLLGQLYVENNNPKKAYSYLSTAYNLRLESGNSAKIASSLYYLGTYYTSIHNYDRALELLLQCEQLSRESADHRLLADVLFGEITVLKKRSETNELLAKYEELLSTRELIAIEENRKTLTRIEIVYDVQRKNREIQSRRKQMKLDHIRMENQQLRNQQLIGWLVGAGIFMIFIIAASYQLNIRKRRIEIQNKELESQKEEIIHLHHELSHRTKNYFGMLSGILKSGVSNTNNQETIHALNQNIRRLDAMSLVQHYLLDDSTQRNKEVRLDAYLSKLTDLVVLNLFPHGSNLILEKKIDPIYLDYDIAMRLAIVLNELLCNAIEHGLEGVQNPEIHVSVFQNNNKITLIVKDNGSGIVDQLTQSSNTKGLGLIPKLLKKVNGTIDHYNEGGCVAKIMVNVENPGSKPPGLF